MPPWNLPRAPVVVVAARRLEDCPAGNPAWIMQSNPQEPILRVFFWKEAVRERISRGLEMQLPVTDQTRANVPGPESAPEEVVAWSLERFADRTMVMTTSFGMEGCALIDMYARHGRPMTVIYLDTMFFFPE